MKKLFLTLATVLAFSPVLAWASCTTTTIFSPEGGITVCTTCCNGGNCTVTCI